LITILSQVQIRKQKLIIRGRELGQSANEQKEQSTITAKIIPI
jgi:hypothetical protein